jgi:hypothetical protein
MRAVSVADQQLASGDAGGRFFWAWGFGFPHNAT